MFSRFGGPTVGISTFRDDQPMQHSTDGPRLAPEHMSYQRGAQTAAAQLKLSRGVSI